MGILVIKGQNRRTIYALKSPNMGSESCTVLRLRVMRKLAMCRIRSISWLNVD